MCFLSDHQVMNAYKEIERERDKIKVSHFENHLILGKTFLLESLDVM